MSVRPLKGDGSGYMQGCVSPFWTFQLVCVCYAMTQQTMALAAIYAGGSMAPGSLPVDALGLPLGIQILPHLGNRLDRQAEPAEGVRVCISAHGNLDSTGRHLPLRDEATSGTTEEVTSNDLTQRLANLPVDAVAAADDDNAFLENRWC
ncbi:hypothetical protein SprV_0200793900 [Sparganum proliferum]